MPITWKTLGGLALAIMTLLVAFLGIVVSAINQNEQLVATRIVQFEQNTRDDRDKMIARMDRMQERMNLVVESLDGRVRALEQGQIQRACREGDETLCPGSQQGRRWDRGPSPGPFIAPEDLLR